VKTILVLLLALGFSNAHADTFKIDGAHSAVTFKVRHILSKTEGKFKDFDGEFTFDEKKPDAASGKMTIKTASIDTSNEKRDTHLKSPDFFDVAKFDTITYVSKKFKKAGKGKYKLEGDMTLRGITKPVAFDVEYLGTLEKDPFGMKRTSFTAATKINRKDFGMVWNKSMDEDAADKAKKFVSKNLLGDEVEIALNIEATAGK
jgi:polyisoprenoid-binding protein YceI